MAAPPDGVVAAPAAVLLPPPALRRRLRGKTSVQTPVVGAAAMDDDVDMTRKVFLITFSHPQVAASAEGFPLVPPERFSRGEVATKVKEAFGSPVADPAWQRRNPLYAPVPVAVVKLVVYREMHKDTEVSVGHAHYHVAVLLARVVRFPTFKRALLYHFGLASNWSLTHSGYWSAVRYGVMPSPDKPQSSLDPCPLAWAASGQHPDLMESCHEPHTASATRARRDQSLKAASEAAKPEPRVQEIDIWPIIVQHGFKNTPDDTFAAERLIQHAKSYCSPNIVAFLFKNRHRLSSLIDDIWAWETVDDILALAGRTRTDIFAAAVREPCSCGGRWIERVRHALGVNQINVGELCHNVLLSLERGRGETAPVVVLAGKQGGEGKSLFLSPLTAIFGEDNVQHTPQKGNFPLLGIEHKRIALLDEWRFDESVLSMPLQLLWFEGKTVLVTRPQNIQGVTGNILYRGSAPIFITTKQNAITALAAQSVAGASPESSMLLRRLARVLTGGWGIFSFLDV